MSSVEEPSRVDGAPVRVVQRDDSRRAREPPGRVRRARGRRRRAKEGCSTPSISCGSKHGQKVRDVTVLAADAAHLERIVAAVRSVEGVAVDHVSDRTFLLHLGGKLEMRSKSPIKTRDDLSMAYTPGVARICRAIADDPAKVWNLTIKQNTVAVVSDGTAVLGLGDIGAGGGDAGDGGQGGAVQGVRRRRLLADLPVASTDPDEIVACVKAIAPGFGGINLEDISAPRCFEIEDRLRAELDIPVFHDDQHGTAVVCLAALINALKVVGKRLDEVKVVVTGVGAAGVATTKMLLAAGVTDVSAAIAVGRSSRAATASTGTRRRTLRRRIRVVCRVRRTTCWPAPTSSSACPGPASSAPRGFAGWRRDAVVFAMANPTPEVLPEEIHDAAAVIGTGRSDYPNQINNVLAFPGIFRGALDARASEINEEMKLAAAHAIADAIPEDALERDYVIPSVFDRSVAPKVAAAVAQAAHASGVARRRAGTSLAAP